ncbi:MAG TPA: hypothetical protein VE174_10960 [Actinomycetota bacterium]|nr:hypothetical protein [Actinomycetota bacterium]
MAPKLRVNAKNMKIRRFAERDSPRFRVRDAEEADARVGLPLFA